MFENGFVLRQPRVSGANNPSTSDPSVHVLSRDSNGNSTSDRDEYLGTFIGTNASKREYLITPAGTSNLVVGEEFIQETPSLVDQEGLVYQFNQSGLSFKDFSLVSGDTPDKVDLAAGLLSYDTVPVTAPVVQYRQAALSLFYTRNDAVQRFGFDDRVQRWRTLPGAPPELLGALPDDLLTPLTLTSVEPDVGTPRVVIGSLDSAPVPVTFIGTQAEWQDYLDGTLVPNVGEAAAFADTGEILFASDVILASVNLPVFQYRYSGFPLDSNTGFMGIIGEEDIYLNPVPQATELPLVRSRYGSYLTVAKSTDPVGTEEVRYDVGSGKLTFQDTDRDGLRLYYDGVYSVTAPVESFPPTSLGTITPNFASTTGISNIDASVYDRTALILYVQETGEVIQDLEFVEESSDLPLPSKIPAQKAVLFYDSGADEVQIQLSFSFMRSNSGNTLSVGTGDFYFEDGVTFRMDRSLKPGVDPDARSRVRIQDEVLVDGIAQGAFAILPQVPLQDISGYQEDTFFRVKSNGSTRTLTPDEDIVYDFDSSQIKWAERESQTQSVTQNASSVKLPHEVLLDRNFTFELDQGGGFQTLTPGETVIADFDLGNLAFAEPFGKDLYEGFGVFSGSTFTDVDASFNFALDIGNTPAALDEYERPLLVLTSTGEVYRIESATSTTLTLSAGVPSPLTNVPYVVLEGPDVVYEYAFQETSLTRRTVFPSIVSDLDTNASSLFVPDGETFTFESNGVVQAQEILSRETLGRIQDAIVLPAKSLEVTSNFEVYRESELLTFVAGAPSATGEYTFDGGTGAVTFFASDVVTFVDDEIVLRPLLSTGRATGPVEVLSEDRSLGLPADLVGVNLTSIVLLRQDQYLVQTTNGQLFFVSSFRSGDRLRVRYFINATQDVTEQTVSFETRERLTFAPGSLTATFGAGVDVDTSKAATFLVNGASSTAVIDLVGKTVTLSSPPISGRTYQIGYFREGAQGGEKTATLLQSPFQPSVTFIPGTTQTFLGDQTSDLQVGSVLEVDDLSLRVVSASYDMGTDLTSVEVSPALSETLVGPGTIRVSTRPVDRTTTLSVQTQVNSVDDQELVIFGDLTGEIFPNRILFLDGEPYGVTGVTYDLTEAVSRVVVRSRLLREYVNPLIAVSDEVVYDEDPGVLATNRALFAAQEVSLIRLAQDGTGTRLIRGVQFEVTDAGDIALDPTNVTLPVAGERWVLSYLARDTVGPFTSSSGTLVIPRLRSTYTRFIAATNATFAGGQLIGRYSISSPDTFYFRALPLEEYAQEVQETLASSSGTSGPSLSFGSSQALSDKGSLTLLGEELDVRDRDRVGRAFISLYNDVAQDFETYLQALDGRVIGDRDGQFKFFIAPNDQPGGEDPVSGELLPYYANPDGTGSKPSPAQVEDVNLLAQEGFIRNSIDDLVLRSKKPFQFTFPLTFEYLGTFSRAWEASRLSRFYPQRSTVVTITPPDLSGSGDYDFFEDFGTTLGDLDQDDVLSIETLTKRPPQAWLISNDVATGSGTATLNAGMVFALGDTQASNPGVGQNLTDGDSTNQIPGFAVDDVVNLGRVVYQTNPSTGLVEREETFYAQNMVVTAVSGDSVTLGQLDQNFFDTLFPGAGISFGGLNITVTDPATLDGTTSPAAGYTSATSVPRQNDTLFGTSLNPYRQGYDFGVDASEGELINRALPDFLATLTGQVAPPPLTYLTATIIYKNQRTEPFRFPALDGEALDDDGLQNAPYGYPLLDSESVSLGNEETALDDVREGTTLGIVVEATTGTLSTLTTTQDLTDVLSYPTPPRPYDLLLLEDEVAGGSAETGGSTPFVFSAATATEVKLAAFEVFDGGVSYALDDAFPGTGTGSGTTWTDGLARDFTILTGLSGVLDIGGTLFTVTSFGAGTIEVAAGPLPASGAFNLNLTGTGDITELHALEDTFDFSSWSDGLILRVLSGINSGTYTVAQGNNGSLEPETVPVSYGTGNLAVATTGIEVQGTGSALGGSPTLFNVPGVDFTPYGPESTLYVLNTNVSGEATAIDIHDVSTFGNQILEVTPAISTTGTSLEFYLTQDRLFSVGDAAVSLGLDAQTLYVRTDLSNLELREGDTLVIPPTSPNGGRYTIETINLTSSPYATIRLNTALRQTEGDVTNANPALHSFPVRFTTSRPRRFSAELDALRDAQLQRRVLYDSVANAPTSPVDIQDLLVQGNYEALNPAAPSLAILNRLILNAFDSELAQASDATLVDLGSGQYALESLSSNFVAQDVQDDTDERASFVLIPEGDSRGYYRVAEVLSTTQVRLRETTEFPVDFLTGIALGGPFEFSVLEGERFDDRTYELVLYEFVNVKEILDRLDAGIESTLHDTQTFTSADLLIANPGETQDATLQSHLDGSYSVLPIGVQDRQAFLTGAPSLIDEVEAVLAGTENLYDSRFAWIDFRINLEAGTLPTRRRLIQDRAKRKRARLQNSLRT